MAILKKQSVDELRRIIKEATGRDLSLGEAYLLWHYLIKLLQLLWKIEHRRELSWPPNQPNLFGRQRKKETGKLKLP